MYYRLPLLFFLLICSNPLSFGQKANADAWYFSLTRRRVDSTIKTSGLALDGKTITSFRSEIDSLNEHFARNYKDSEYFFKPEAIGHAIFLSEGNSAAVIKAIKAGITFENLCKKYPHAEILKDRLITKEIKRKASSTVFSSLSVYDETGDFKIDVKSVSVYDKKFAGEWVYTEDTSDGISAIYFPKGFISKKVPEKYVRMVRYADLMTGRIPTDSIFHSKVIYSGRWGRPDTSAKVTAFLSEVAAVTNRPEIPEPLKSDSNTMRNYRNWYFSRWAILNKKMASDRQFKWLFDEALTDALANGCCNEEMEDYAECYGSKEQALYLKRGRRVYGSCGNDDIPRYHLYNIASLAAKTMDRQLFLTTCLYLITDCLEEIFRQRSYIDELEKLGFDSQKLLFGILILLENQSGIKTYVDDMPFAIAKHIRHAKNEQEFVASIVEMIKDKELDDYNRLFMSKVFLNYINVTIDKNKKEQNISTFKNAMSTLPVNYTRNIKIRR